MIKIIDVSLQSKICKKICKYKYVDKSPQITIVNNLLIFVI